MNKQLSQKLKYLLLIFVFAAAPVWSQTSTFTYQGKLIDAGAAANGAYDMQFRLFDMIAGASQVGPTATVDGVQVSAGIFTVQLDFGTAVFTGAERFLEIRISPAGQNNYVTLAPRQRLTAAPYSVRSFGAVDSLNLGGIPAGQYVQTNDARLSDDRNPLAGSNNYIQNTGIPQPGVNFSIGGTGSASVLRATSQFNLGNNRVLATPGLFNLVVGPNAGTSLVSPGSQNSFFGHDSGNLSTTAQFNSFFGNGSGRNNTTGSRNVFAGWGAGQNNTAAGDNAFFGVLAGQGNTTGGLNTYIGKEAGNLYRTGSSNTFVGAQSGAPISEFRDGNNNTAVGFRAWAEDGLSFATAIGAGAIVGTSNTVALGRSADAVQVPGTLGVGTATPQARLDVRNGNILLGSPGQGIILKSPDGVTCRLLSIDNAGALITTVVACP